MILLRKKRLERDWSQAELGRRCKVHPSLISKIEALELKPWKKISAKLQKIFETPIHQLLQEIREEGK